MKPKRFLGLLCLFLVIFLLTYVSSCYLIPGLRIKLSADPFTYFCKSLTQMVTVKTIISVVVSGIATMLAYGIERKIEP